MARKIPILPLPFEAIGGMNTGVTVTQGYGGPNQIDDTESTLADSHNSYLYYSLDFGFASAGNTRALSVGRGTVVDAWPVGALYNASQDPSNIGIFATIYYPNLGIYASYFHLDEVFVSVGDVLELGQPAGYVGSTGVGTGEHLHFQVGMSTVNFQSGTIADASIGANGSTPAVFFSAADAADLGMLREGEAYASDNSISTGVELRGTISDNILIGGRRDDVLVGGAGADGINGKGGADDLFGGPDDDTYAYGVDDGRDTIFDDAGSFDVLEIYGIDQVWSARDNLIFRRSGDDLVINVVDWNGDPRGSVTIQDADSPSSQIEYLALIGADSVTKIGEANPVGEFDRLDANGLPWARAGDDAPEVRPGRAETASGWWTASDPDGDRISWWAVWDENGSAESSYFSTASPVWVFRDDWQQVDGRQLPAGEAVVMESNVFRSLVANGGSAGASDDLWAIAWDGEEWGNWARLTLTSSELDFV